jgi:4-amino-4-deoxy-L-arabinose transferase-like glycosyltransferase
VSSISATFTHIARSGSTLALGRTNNRPRWVLPALCSILICAAVLLCWGMAGSEYNAFYASAARSMSESWKAFLFGSFSPANTITIDKIPGYLWPQALSVRLFGFHSWSLILPQIIEALVTLLATYRLVRGWAGEAAAVLAAGLLALTPALIAVGHTNNEEACYVMCLALAAGAAQRAAVSGRVRSLILAGVWIGLAFQCKMLEAWALFPAVAAAYLLAAPPRASRRVVHVLAAGLATVAVSLWWVVLVTLVPASDRPYLDGTTNDNAFSLVFGYNGLTRFSSLGISPSSVGSVGQAGGGPAGATSSSGMATMFQVAQTSQVGWLYPLAAVSIALLLWQRRGKPRTDPLRAGVILAAVWIATYALAYSAGSIHSYYVVTLAPPLAMVSGAGAVELWRTFRAGGGRAWALPITLALTDIWAISIAAGVSGRPGWLIPLLIAVGVTVLIALAVVRFRPTVSRRVTTAAIAVAVLVPVAGPVAWDSTVITAGDDMSLAMGTVGPSAAGAGAFGGGGFGSGFAGRPGGADGGGFPFAGGKAGSGAAAGSGGASNGMWVSDGTLSADQRDVLDYAQAHSAGAAFVLTVSSWSQASPYVLRAGADVLSLGGFSGSAPFPTLSQFEQYVAEGEVRYVYLPTSGSSSGFGGNGGQANTTAAQIQAWVPAHCSTVPASAYGGSTSTTADTLYLCSHT